MNREKIIELAREAELARQFALEVPFVVDRLERFVGLVEAEQTNQFTPDWDTVSPLVEEQQRMALRIEELENALSQLLIILGPTPPECCGCAYEWQTAIDLIKKELE